MSKACSAGCTITHGGVGASALAYTGWLHMMRTGASAPGRVVYLVTWGSASADRSVITSRSLPRTPVTPPERAGLPASRDRATGAFYQASCAWSPASRHGVLRSIALSVPPGTGSLALLGARVAQFQRGMVPGALRSLGAALRRRMASSTPRGADRCPSFGTGNPALFGGLAAPSRTGLGLRLKGQAPIHPES